MFLPLPFGANVPPGWAAAVIGINGLAIIWLLLWALNKGEVTPAFRKAWPVVVLLVLWLLWIALQLAPLPMGLLDTLSPKAAELQTQAAKILQDPVPETGTISLDRHATQSSLIKSVSYVALFCLTLLLVDSRRRLRMLAWGGRYLEIGTFYTGTTFEMDPGRLVGQNQRFEAVAAYDAISLQRAIEFLSRRADSLPLDDVVVDYSLENIEQAFADQDAGRVKRASLVMA